MKYIRRSSERGYADHGWLKSYHSFSFANYFDRQFMGFGSLRVINEDFIAGGAGFPMHGHSDMEIVTVVIEGALEHKDTLGNSAVMRPGEVQRMSAGTGIRHSEFNHYKDKTCHLLQIWIETNKPGAAPGYEQKDFQKDWNKKGLTLVASEDGSHGSVMIQQDAKIYRGLLEGSESVSYEIANGRGAWIQIVSGALEFEGQKMSSGDALAVSDEKNISLKALESTTFLLFDVV